MEKLKLPAYQFRITKDKAGQTLIFDPIRKKSIVLTPEEWVRQNMVQYLVEEKGFPPSLFSIEAGLKVNTMARRYDVLIYSTHRQPLMLLECKAPKVNISQDTFDQVTAYNLSIKAQYLLVTNGMKHYCCKLNEAGDGFEFLKDIPEYRVL